MIQIWLGDSAFVCESLYKVPYYRSLYQVRNHGKGGGVSIYLNKAFSFKVRTNLSVSNRDIESFSTEILLDKRCNILSSVLYRLPSGIREPSENFLKDIFSKTNNSNKIFYIAGHFNLNSLNYDNCKKIQDFVNLIYDTNSMIPMVNKPTRLTRKTARVIDHSITNCSFNSNFKTLIFKSDIFDHFLIIFFLPLRNPLRKKPTYIYASIVNYNFVQMFRQKLYETDWTEIVTRKID